MKGPSHSSSKVRAMNFQIGQDPWLLCPSLCLSFVFFPLLHFLFYIVSIDFMLCISLILKNEVISLNVLLPVFLLILHVERLSLACFNHHPSKLCTFFLSVTSAMSCWDMCPCFQIVALLSFHR
jgi:hypothetical protein